jgi:hypothetical protein
VALARDHAKLLHANDLGRDSLLMALALLMQAVMHPMVSQLFRLYRIEAAPTLHWPPTAKPAFDSLATRLRANVEPRAIEIYDSLRAQNKRPFAALVDGICAACHFRVLAESVEALKTRKEIPLCQICGRFLHPPNAELLIDSVNPEVPNSAAARTRL